MLPNSAARNQANRVRRRAGPCLARARGRRKWQILVSLSLVRLPPSYGKSICYGKGRSRGKSASPGVSSVLTLRPERRSLGARPLGAWRARCEPRAFVGAGQVSSGEFWFAGSLTPAEADGARPQRPRITSGHPLR
jgi:hypothetical protein